MQTKCCTRCGQEKPLTEFPKRPQRKSGYRSQCLACGRRRNKEWRDLQIVKMGYKRPWRNVPVAEGMKCCSRCMEVKPVADFIMRTGRESPNCRDCRYAHTARHYNPAASRAIYLRRKFNITPEQYDALAQSQGGVCAICGEFSPTPAHPVLVVDHDHATGEVRGLLCHSCNLGIGNLRDSADLLARALAYLKGGATC